MIKPRKQSAFVALAMKKHKGKYSYALTKYKNSRTPIKILCPLHGEFMQAPSNHLHGAGCRSCAREGHRVALTKKRIGWLVPLMDVGLDVHGSRLWKCQCKCGNTKILPSSVLMKETVTSCGCKKHRTNHENPLFKGYGEISKSFWNSLLRGAKARNIKVTLTIQDAWKLFLKQKRRCALSGELLILGSKSKGNATASLDRIDSSQAYTIENCQWVHKDVNICKQSMSNSEFISMCRKISSHSKK